MEPWILMVQPCKREPWWGVWVREWGFCSVFEKEKKGEEMEAPQAL